MQNSNDIWYVHVHGAAYGPYTDTQMRSYIEEGRLNAQSLVSKNTANDFMNAMNHAEFAHWTNRINQSPEPVLRPVSNPTSKGVLARDHYQSEPVNTRVIPAPAQPEPVVMQPTPSIQPVQAPQPIPSGQPLQPVPQPSQAPQPVQTPPQSLTAPQSQPVQQPVQNLTAPQNTATEAPAQKVSVFIIMAEIRSDNGLAFLQTLQQKGVAQRIGDSVWILRGYTTAQMLRNALSQSLTADDRLFILDSFANETAWFNIGTDMDRQIRELWDLDTSP